LATSRVWINNNNFPYYVRKQHGQYYLQTWHGTPVKKMLNEIPRRRLPLTYRRLMKNEVSQWDAIIAQNEVAGSNLKRALGYRGPVIIMEYPRNTQLRKSADEILNLRSEFKIDKSDYLILYLPTWRPNTRANDPKPRIQQFPAKSIQKNNKIKVMLRSHHMNKSEIADSDKIIDASGHPHVEDLMAMADLLITDYSSVMYDFKQTGKPIILYQPDKKIYEASQGIHSSRMSDFQIAENPDDLVSLVEHASERCLPRGESDSLKGAENELRMLASEILSKSFKGTNQLRIDGLETIKGISK